METTHKKFNEKHFLLFFVLIGFGFSLSFSRCTVDGCLASEPVNLVVLNFVKVQYSWCVHAFSNQILQWGLAKPVAVGPIWVRKSSNMSLCCNARAVLERNFSFPVFASSRFISDEAFRANCFSCLYLFCNCSTSLTTWIPFAPQSSWNFFWIWTQAIFLYFDPRHDCCFYWLYCGKRRNIAIETHILALWISLHDFDFWKKFQTLSTLANLVIIEIVHFCSKLNEYSFFCLPFFWMWWT